MENVKINLTVTTDTPDYYIANNPTEKIIKNVEEVQQNDMVDDNTERSRTINR